jgi:hypothetical protein
MRDLSLTNHKGLTVEYLTFLGLDVNLTTCPFGITSSCPLVVKRNRITTARMTLSVVGR